MVNIGFIDGGSRIVSTPDSYLSSSLVKITTPVENKVLYTGDPSSVISSYLSLLDLRINKNNGVLDQYSLDTKLNLYAGDQIANPVPIASSLQDVLSKRNRLYYLATTSYQFWS